jgi:hypothetical protein
VSQPYGPVTGIALLLPFTFKVPVVQSVKHLAVDWTIRVQFLSGTGLLVQTYCSPHLLVSFVRCDPGSLPRDQWPEQEDNL